MSRRLFVAFDLPSEVKGEIARRLERRGHRLPRARWVKPEVLHLTLHFLGDTEDDRISPLRAALREVFASQVAVSLRLQDGGSFPPGRPARVLWLGVVSSPDLSPLQTRVGETCRSVAGGIEEGRGFTPHLTLARCDPPWREEAVAAFTSAFAGPVAEEFSAGPGILFSSELGPGGARHQRVEEFPLRGAA